MGDRSLTLFEVHLHDGLSFSATNTAPAIGGDGGERESEETDVETEAADPDEGFEDGESESAGGNGLKVLIGLVLVAGLAIAARKLMGDEDLEQLEELEDLAVDA
jgi:hypothetical protein